jgi:hypothetical protein
VPRREREPAAIDARPGSPAAAVGYTAVAVFLLMGSAMNLPVNRVLDYRPGPGPVPPTVRLDVDRANVLIRVGPNDAAPLHIHGAVHGFGLPTYQIRQTTTRSGGPRPVLAYTLRQRGWFSELDTRVTVDVGAQVQRVVVKVDDGRVRVVRTAGFPARRSVKAE